MKSFKFPAIVALFALLFSGLSVSSASASDADDMRDWSKSEAYTKIVGSTAGYDPNPKINATTKIQVDYTGLPYKNETAKLYIRIYPSSSTLSNLGSPLGTKIVDVKVDSRGNARATFRPYDITKRLGTFKYSALLSDLMGPVDAKFTLTKSKAEITRVVTSANATVKPFEGRYSDQVVSNAKKNYATFSVWPSAGQRVYLQRKVKGKWKNVKSATLANTGSSSDVKFKLPNYKKKTTYRIYVNASSVNTASKSAYWKVSVSNAKKYKTQIKKARKYVKKYCPSTPIYVLTDGSSTSGAGSKIGYSRTNSEMVRFYEDAIIMSTTKNSRSIRSTAARGCATILETKLELASNKQEKKHNSTVKKLFKFSKGDRRAPGFGNDNRFSACLAYSMTKDKMETTYTKCSGKRLAYAKSFLKSYSKTKAQRNPVHSWYR